MTHTDDALTEAVAKAMYEDREGLVWEYLYPNWRAPWRRRATVAITAVRTFDDQAALNCGHCTPNTDEIACACVVQSREDDGPFISCPDCSGTGIVGGPDPACPTCGTRGSIPAFALKIKERDDARHGMAIDEATDRILALIAEAMLSEEAVVTAVYAGMRHRPNTPSHYRATTKAQLAAAGITGAATTD